MSLFKGLITVEVLRPLGYEIQITFDVLVELKYLEALQILKLQRFQLLNDVLWNTLKYFEILQNTLLGFKFKHSKIVLW